MRKGRFSKEGLALDDEAMRESKERIVSAIRLWGYKIAQIRKHGVIKPRILGGSGSFGNEGGNPRIGIYRSRYLKALNAEYSKQNPLQNPPPSDIDIIIDPCFACDGSTSNYHRDELFTELRKATKTVFNKTRVLIKGAPLVKEYRPEIKPLKKIIDTLSK